MSATERKAWMTEALKVAHFWRQNATKANHVPECAPQTTLGPVEPESPPVTNVNITNQIPAAPTATETLTPGAAAAGAGKSLVRTAAPFLLTALGAGLPAAGISYWLLKDEGQPVPSAVVEPADGSLLQYLEDRGDHLGEGEPWTK